jgi:putative DNA-invertase from lambdoid prophage Rac
MKTAAAIYMRVSTNRQTVENQRPDVDRLVALRGFDVIERYEEQVSASAKRPEFERMMNDAKAGKFTVLVVWALDRFGRNMGGNIADILALDKAGVKVVSVKEPWMDTGGPVRELLVAIFSWVAQQEKARLIERTKAGLALAKARGIVLGRPSAVLLPEAERTSVIQTWRDGGRPGGVRALARELGGCSPTTAARLAK